MISREEEVRLTSHFLHLVRFFQLYNILKNQNRAFFTFRPPLALRSGGGGVEEEVEAKGWRLRGCSLRLRGCRWRLRGCTLGLRGGG